MTTADKDGTKLGYRRDESVTAEAAHILTSFAKSLVSVGLSKEVSVCITVRPVH